MATAPARGNREVPTLAITDFRHGLDTRKGALTAEGGSLQALTNAVITPGGDIEKRKAFVLLGTLPATTFGLFAQGSSLHTFGTASPGTVGAMPTFSPIAGLGDPNLGLSTSAPVVYHQLDATAGAMTDLVAIETYKNKFFVTGGITGPGAATWWDGLPVAHRYWQRAYQSKMYSVNGSSLFFSSIGDPSQELNTVLSPGGGFIDMAEHDPDGASLTGLEIYYNSLAVFSRRAVQIWNVDPDPTLNTLKQVLRVGSLGPRSIRQFGTGDVLFLSDSGIRSLRALNYTLAAGVNDVGSPVDKFVVAAVLANPQAAYLSRAVLQPVTGRYWLSIDATVYVLSFFPSGKISAWSLFTLPFAPREWAVLGNRVFCRATNNNVYLYGGPDDATYDSCEVRVRTPHLAADKPTIMKKPLAITAICTGAWSLAVGTVTDNTALFELVANVVGPTTAQHRIPVSGHGTHMGVEMVSAAPGYALMSSVALDYTMNEKL